MRRCRAPSLRPSPLGPVRRGPGGIPPQPPARRCNPPPPRRPRCLSPTGSARRAPRGEALPGARAPSSLRRSPRAGGATSPPPGQSRPSVQGRTGFQVVPSPSGRARGSQADDRARERPSNPPDRLDSGHHEPAERVDGAGLHPGDDVVWPRDDVGRDRPSELRQLSADRGGPPGLGLDHHVLLHHLASPPLSFRFSPFHHGLSPHATTSHSGWMYLPALLLSAALSCGRQSGAHTTDVMTGPRSFRTALVRRGIGVLARCSGLYNGPTGTVLSR